MPLQELAVPTESEPAHMTTTKENVTSRRQPTKRNEVSKTVIQRRMASPAYINNHAKGHSTSQMLREGAEIIRILRPGLAGEAISRGKNAG